VICLDEADEMLNIGFKEDIEKIFKFINKARSNTIQCLMFSATLPDWIWKISELYQSKTKQFINLIKEGNVKTSKTV
jgi:ATP-dependent RNA helicase DDX21